MSYTGVWGDSLAVGLQGALGLGGSAKVGLGPSAIADMLQSAITSNPSAFKGAKPLISSGLSNNPQDIQGVKRQIALLKQAGANPSFIGLAQGRYDAQNNLLSLLTRQSGVGFLGGFKPGSDAVHPESYSNLYSIPKPAAVSSSSSSSSPSRGIVDIGKYLQRMGLRVGENPAFGGVGGGHSPTGYHPKGLAIDVTDWRPDMAPAYEGGPKLDWKTRTGNLSWRGKQLQKQGLLSEVLGPGDPGHDTHVHMALEGTKPLTDQQLEWLATGRYKTAEGKLTDIMPGADLVASTQQKGESSEDDLSSLMSLLQLTKPKQRTLQEVMLEQTLGEALAPQPSMSQQFLAEYMSSPLPGVR